MSLRRFNRARRGVPPRPGIIACTVVVATLALMNGSFMPVSHDVHSAGGLLLNDLYRAKGEPLLHDSLNDTLLSLPMRPHRIDTTWAADLPAASRHRLTILLPEKVRPLFPDARDSLLIDPETLWLARCIYSESNLPHEQELVAWVVRNRVATAYRGKTTYHDVVLDPYQFSAFNPGSKHRRFYLSLMPDYAHPHWQRALIIAAFVRSVSWSKRPFPVTVRHFYSEISMKGRRHPEWAVGETMVLPQRTYDIDPYRFRFFSLSE